MSSSDDSLPCISQKTTPFCLPCRRTMSRWAAWLPLVGRVAHLTIDVVNFRSKLGLGQGRMHNVVEKDRDERQEAQVTRRDGIIRGMVLVRPRIRALFQANDRSEVSHHFPLPFLGAVLMPSA